MAKIKIWNGSVWVSLDASNSDSLGGSPASDYLKKADLQAGEGISLSGSTFSLADITAGATTIGAVAYSGTTRTAGKFYGGTTAPNGTTRLNYNGYLYATRLHEGTTRVSLVGHTHAWADITTGIPDASTSAKGIVQLSDATNSTSTTLAATANAVKRAYDLAQQASSGGVDTTNEGVFIGNLYNKPERSVLLGHEVMHYDGDGHSVLIGYVAEGGSYAVSIGAYAISYANLSVCIGDWTEISMGASGSVVIGSSASSMGSNGIAIGSSAQIYSSSAVAIGPSAEVHESRGISIGGLSRTYEPDSVTIGYGAQSHNFNNITIGSGAKAFGLGTIVIGPNVTTHSESSVVIGTAATCNSDYSVVIGRSAKALGGDEYNSIAIGAFTVSGSDDAIAIGPSTQANGSLSIAIGSEAVTSGSWGIAIGRAAEANGHSSYMIGNYNQSYNNNTGYLGELNTVWTVEGSFSVSGTKNFEIPSPVPGKEATHVIRHGAVETPSAGDNLYRFKVSAQSPGEVMEVSLPDYFPYLNTDVQIWVTGADHFGKAFGKIEHDLLKVTCETPGDYNVLVIGTRNDSHHTVQNWHIRGVEREVGESWGGETYEFIVDEYMEINEIIEEEIR